MNKIERMRAVFHNETPDVTPAGFWFHYNGADSVEKMINNHLELYRATDMDIIKVMLDYPYPSLEKIKTPSDWKNIRLAGPDSPEFKKLAQVMEGILDQTGDEVMSFQTMYGPMKAAAIAFGDELVMTHAKENPKQVKEGLARIAESLAKWAEAFIKLGASGIYYSAQFAEPGRFTHEQWQELVAPYDYEVLTVADRKSDAYNILHICGEPDYNFKTNVAWFKDYPADLVNWSVKDNQFSLQKGRELFNKPILGGMDNKGNILSASKEQIQKEAKEVLKQVDKKGFMLGADCTIQGEGITLERIQNAVEIAHQN